MSVPSITDTRQYLSFELDGESFGIDVTHVREILEFSRLTGVPRTPAYMKGVINLRGSVVPVIDMRLKFGLPEIEKTINTCIVVVEVSTGDETMIIGALVDSVQEVFELESGQIEPAPRTGVKLEAGFIKGMGKRDDNFVIILDINGIFTVDDLVFTHEANVA